MRANDYATLSDAKLASLLEQIAEAELSEVRGVLLLEAARRLRDHPTTTLQHNDGCPSQENG